MSRTRNLILTVALLAAGNVAWYVWSHWGLITVHSHGRPLGEVIRSIEKQGRARIATDRDLTLPVTMDVEKVVLAEALETLSTVTDSRWRLAYFVAGDRPSIDGALTGIVSGQRPEGWKTSFVPLPPIGIDEPAVPLDPRRDRWETKTPPEQTLQAFLDQAAQSVSASFFVPVAWNPSVSKPPKSGPIRQSLAKLASATGSKYEEVFLLQKSGRGARDQNDDEEGPRPMDFSGPGGGGRGAFNREAMQERIKAEIEKLPPEKRTAAQKEFDERRAMFESLRDLPPEQRRAKMEEVMQNPAAQERAENMQSARDARRTPQQRVDRAQRYMERKMQAQNSTQP